MNAIEQKAKSVMSIILDIPITDIKPELTQDNYSTWDSLKHLDMVVALEEEFDVNIPEEEIGNLLSLQLISVIIQECIDAK